MSVWLLKSEPSVYGIADLERDGTSLWDGVRNYQARNYLRAMRPGDVAFFYHSSTTPAGIVGLVRVRRGDVVDPTQFDPSSPYHDPRATPAAPRWFTVEVELVRRFARLVSLDELRAAFGPDELLAVRRGNRLSVLPVPDAVADRILAMADGS